MYVHSHKPTCVCITAHMWHMEVRRQFAGVVSLQLAGSRVKLVSKNLYPQSHLASSGQSLYSDSLFLWCGK